MQDQTLISNYFNNFFCSIGKYLSNSAASQENYEFRDYLSNRVSSSIFLNSPSLTEIVKSIQSLNMNKALGHDNISPLFLKTARDIVALFLQVFIDFSFKNGIFPDNCKTAKIFPLHKKGDVNNPSNFRPISILSCFSKIYEQVLYNRLVKFLDKHNVITPTQYGFQKGISTTHAILDIVTNAFDNIHRKKLSGLIFLNLQKAFDTVNHSILLSKLDHYGIRGPADRLIESFLDRKQYVCLSGCRSDLKSIKYGVAQGSKIGPLLFLIYINDLPNSVHCIPRLFADDTCLLLADANLNSLHENINNELINLSHWCKANKLLVNPVKSNAMIISPKQCNAYPTPTTSLLYDEVPVKIVNEFKYLGVVLDSKFDFHAHIQLIENKISRAVGIISKLKHIFPSDALLKLYYSLLHPYLLYGLHIWGSTYRTYQARLGGLQNRAVKLIGGGNFRDSPNLFYSKLNILKLPDLFKHETAKLVYRFFHDDLPTTLTELFVKNS